MYQLSMQGRPARLLGERPFPPEPKPPRPPWMLMTTRLGRRGASQPTKPLSLTLHLSSVFLAEGRRMRGLRVEVAAQDRDTNLTPETHSCNWSYYIYDTVLSQHSPFQRHYKQKSKAFKNHQMAKTQLLGFGRRNSP